jgi:hypothetical protein
MARFDTSGLDDIFAEMSNEGELVGDVADKMLIAGVKIIQRAWKSSAERHRHRLSGDLIDSITYSEAKNVKAKGVESIRAYDVYPQGKDRKGVRNAEKAFILNYGAPKKGIAPSHFIDEADDMCAAEVVEEMSRIWAEEKQ